MKRDNIIMNVIGKQRIGKTTQTRKEMLCAYLKGFKVLIFDPNDEDKLKGYSSKEILEAATIKRSGGKVKVPIKKYLDNPKKTWYIKRLPYDAESEDKNRRLSGIKAYSKANCYGIRRISPLVNGQAVDSGKEKSKTFLGTAVKRQIAKDILSEFRPTDAGRRNGFVFLDDINNYVREMHNDEDFVGTLMNINHRGVDIIIHWHDPMQIPPVLYRFGAIIRLHKIIDQVKESKKLPYNILKLAECIVDEAYERNKRYFLYIDAGEGKIIDPTPQEFQAGAMAFLDGHPKVWRKYGSKEKCVEKYLGKFHDHHG